MRKSVEKMLQDEAKKLPPVEASDSHINETVRLSQLAYEQRRKLTPISLFDFVRCQARFVAAPIWVFQGAVLLLLCVVMQIALTDKALTDRAILLLPISAILVAMTCLPFLARSFKYKMQEVEMTTRMSLSRLTLARLAVAGIGDAIALVAFMLVSFGRLGMTAWNALAYIILPFLLAALICLLILGRLKGQYGLFVCCIFCCLLMAGIGFAIMLAPQILTAIAPAIVAVLCFVSALLLFLEGRRFIRQMSEASTMPVSGYTS